MVCAACCRMALVFAIMHAFMIFKNCFHPFIFSFKKSCLDKLDGKVDHINVSKTLWNKSNAEGD